MIKMISKKEIKKISKKINMKEEEVERILKETFDTISKPSLDNTHCNFNDKIGVGSSDKD